MKTFEITVRRNKKSKKVQYKAIDLQVLCKLMGEKFNFGNNVKVNIEEVK